MGQRPSPYIERHDWNNNKDGQAVGISKSPDLERPEQTAEIEDGAIGDC